MTRQGKSKQSSARPAKRSARAKGKAQADSAAAGPASVRAGGSVVMGDVSISGGEFVGRDKSVSGPSAVTIQALFQPVYQAVVERPNTTPEERADLQAEVKEFEAEVGKGTEADEGYLARRLRNLKRMAPDILEVVLATLANPAAGVGLLMSKITQKMAAEAEAPGA